MRWIGLAPALGALAGAGLINTSSHANYWTTWKNGWAANAIGMLIVLPLALTWSRAHWKMFLTPSQAGIERITLLALIIAISLWVFSQSATTWLYLLTPILLWGAFRLTLLGISLAGFAITAIALGSTLHGYGPISPLNPDDFSRSILWLQLFLGATVLPAFAVALAVTIRHRAEVALQTSEQRLRLITDALPFLVGYLDTDLLFRFANITYQQWFHLSPQEVVGRHIHDVLGEATYQAQRPYLDQALAGQAISFDLGRPDARGYRFVHITYLPHCDDAGEVLGLYALVTDITERKQMEVELFQEKELAQVTLASIGDAVITTDAA